MTPLQKAAYAMLDAINAQGWHKAEMLRKALADEMTQEPVAWLVLDEDLVPIMCAPAKQMCNDHINDAINDFDIAEASKWVVRKAFAHPAPPPAGEVPAGIKELLSEKPITGPCGQCKSSADPCYCGNVNTGESHVGGERAEFEAWASHPNRHGKLPIEAHPNGAYKDKRTYSAHYGWAAAKKTHAQKVAVPTGCHRSHPHEEMSEVCKLKTEIARLKAAHKVDRDDLNRLDEQRLESLRAVECERNAALGQIATMTKDPSWFALKAERDALAADAGRYRWLRRSATRLSFDNALIGSLVRDQSELDGAMEAA